MKFLERVIAGAAKHGISVHVEHFGDDSASLTARRAYGPARVYTVTGIEDATALTEAGTPLCSSDVVQALRRLLERRTG